MIQVTNTLFRGTPPSKPHDKNRRNARIISFFSVSTTLALSSVLLGFMAAIMGTNAWIDALALDRQALLQGEIWRLWTGHFDHFSMQHAWLNALVFAITGNIVERYVGRTNFIIGLLLSCALISLALLSWQPNLMQYRGLSAIGTALTVFGLFIVTRQHRAATIYVALFSVLLLAKLLAEVFGISSSAADLTAGVVLEWRAHVLGALCGGVAILLLQISNRNRLKMPENRASSAY